MVKEGTWSDEDFRDGCKAADERVPNRSRHRSYCFTLNNPSFQEITHLLDYVDAKYWCFGFEVGEHGTQHLQGYIQFNNPREFNTVKNLMTRAHIEVAKGTPEQNIAYCSKEGDFYEFGDRPGTRSKKTWEELQEIVANPKENITSYVHNKKAYDAILQQEIKERKVNTKYYAITPIADIINEVHDRFGHIEDLVIIEKLEDLAKYPDDPQNILMLMDGVNNWPTTREMNMYPRGMPIAYKYGYEYKHVKPQRFIIETENKGLFPLYKNI